MVVDAVIDRVPAVVDRVRREVTLARFIGKLAVDQGVRELRDRVEALTAPGGPASSPAGPDRSGPDTADIGATEVAPPPEAEPSGHEEPANLVGVDDLALADYDELPASNIVAKLASLDPTERTLIEQYERAGRNRRTVLGKIAQLGDDLAAS